MKYFLCTLILFSEVCFAKITVDEHLAKKTSNRKIAQFDLLAKAQDRLNSFIKCSEKVTSQTSPLESEASKCIQNQFHAIQSPVSIVHYFAWFQSDTKISQLYLCTGEMLSLAKDFQQQPKDIFYCLTTKTENTTQSGIISFRVQDEKLKILKIKLM